MKINMLRMNTITIVLVSIDYYIYAMKRIKCLQPFQQIIDAIQVR